MSARRLASVLIALVLAAAVAFAAAGPATAKGKKQGGPTVVRKTVNAPVPDATGVIPEVRWGRLDSAVVVNNKRLKGRTIGDVNLTLQTTGAGADAAEDLIVRLTAPNGATIDALGAPRGQSVGPLTLDDETPVQICNTGPPPPCASPLNSLNPPYAGTARPGEPLSILDGGPIRGTWKLSVFDRNTFTPVAVSTLASWSLSITAAKPVNKVRGAVNVTKPVGAVIPGASGAPPIDGQMLSQIVVGKKFRKASIGDVNVTVQTQGSTPLAATNIEFRLTAPNGNTAFLFSGLQGQSIGPLTLDDEAGGELCNSSMPPCNFDPFESVNKPWTGRAVPDDPLSNIDLGPMRGTWTLRALNQGASTNSTLVLWGLNVTPARPVK